jgi:hypothetical protein
MSQATEATIQLLPGLMQHIDWSHYFYCYEYHPKFGLEKNIISPRGVTGGVVNTWRRCSQVIFDRDRHLLRDCFKKGLAN